MNLDVLNIDDDKMVLFIHKKIMELSKFSNSPKVFQDGYEAIKYITKEKTGNLKFLIFLDINMPKLDGWGVLEELEKLELDRFCFVLIMTSSLDSKQEERAKNHASFIGFIEKPLSIDKLNNLKTTKELSVFFSE
jgi:CheY-like chemotaxis protein